MVMRTDGRGGKTPLSYLRGLQPTDTVMIRILRNTTCGGTFVGVGQQLEASPRDAYILVAGKKAELIEEGEQAPEPAPSTGAPNATQGAVDLSEELGVDLRTVTGTGKGGRITAKDVQDARDGTNAMMDRDGD